MDQIKHSRRQFLQTSAALTTAAIAPMTYAGIKAKTGANGKLNIGVIGCGGRGRANLRGIQGENIYAICDVNPTTLAKTKNKYPNAKVFVQWQKLLEDPKIHAVTVSTADHQHALISIAAMRAGIHVYCEKPLAHTVFEARIMQDEYLKRKGTLATQMGTQIHATENYRRAVELIQSGAIGNISQAHVWCGRTIRDVKAAVLPKQANKENYHWKQWLGPASDRPYNAGYWRGGNMNWNRRWEFGNGVLGDMGSHLVDLPYWALRLNRPTTIESIGPKPHPISCPAWQQVTWEHPPNASNDYLNQNKKVVWYHGKKGIAMRDAHLQKLVGDDTNLKKWFIGVLFIGEKGILVADYKQVLLSPGKKFKNSTPPQKSISQSLGHHQEWLNACKTGQPTLCNFDYSGKLIEHNLLGNVAHRVGKKLQWDATKLVATNAPQASKYLTKQYKKGWAI